MILGADTLGHSRQPIRFSEGSENPLGKLIDVSHHAYSRAELFGAFAYGVANSLRADLAELLEYVPDEAKFIVRAGHGFQANLCNQAYVPAGLLSQAGRALLDPLGRPVALEDFSASHDWADDDLLRKHGARSGIAVKVEAGSQAFGALGVFYREPRTFTPEEERFMLRAAALLGAGVQRLDQEEAAIAWRCRAELLRAGAALLKVPAGPDELLCAAVLAAVSGGAGGSRPISDWCFGDALEANGSFPKLRRVAVDHAEGATERLDEALSATLAPTAPHGAPRVYATRQAELVEWTGPAFISGLAQDPGHRRALEEARPYSYVCAPLVGRERFHGAISFLRTESGTPTPYDAADLAACSDFAALVGEAIDRGLPRPDIAEAQQALRTQLASQPSPAEAASSNPTKREQEVLELIAGGTRLKEIERSLHIGYETVRTHKRHLCQKLNVSTKSPDARIIAEATRRGWLTP